MILQLRKMQLFDSVFSQVSRGDITFNRSFKSSEVLYEVRKFKVLKA